MCGRDPNSCVISNRFEIKENVFDGTLCYIDTYIPYCYLPKGAFQEQC